MRTAETCREARVLNPPPSTLHPRTEIEYAPVRVPVLIRRCADETADVTLFREGEIPAGFVQVPAGSFIFQGDRKDPYSEPRRMLKTGDFFMAKFPVTCGEYRDFLNDLPADEAARRAPRATEKSGFYWARGEDGRYRIPTAEWLASAGQAERESCGKLMQCTADWEEDWPVLSVSWEDAMAYAVWLGLREGILAGVPPAAMWEKACRGVDGRIFPFGELFDDTYANTMRSHDGPARPMPVDSFPIDESPYGARGMCGNSADWCFDDPDARRHKPVRGGSWLANRMRARSPHRGANPQSYVFEGNGFRLAVSPVPSWVL